MLLGAIVLSGAAFAQVTPTVSITAPAAVNEGGTLVYTVTSSAAQATPLTVNFTVTGTATAGADYTAPGTSVVIPANATSATISVVTLDDALLEPNESVVIRLAAGAGYVVAAAPANVAAGFILASDFPVVSIGAALPVVEGGTLVYTVTRSVVQATPLTVRFAVLGTATAGVDYTAPGTSVVIPANATSATISVVTIDDAATEPNETVIIRLAAGTGYTVAAPPANQASGFIRASDPPVVSISVAPAAVNEGGTFVYTVTRSQAAAVPLTVNFTVAGTATAGVDYTSPGTSVVIPANATSATVSVPTINDPTTEPNETVVLSIAARPGVYLIAAAPANRASGLIRASDAVVNATVSIGAPAAVTEGGILTFPVSRAAATASALTVNYSVGGTATSGLDYTALPLTVTIPANATTANVSVITIDDATVESAESVVITLAAGTGYVIGGPASRTGIIKDNDLGAVPNVSINSSSRSCGGVAQVPCNNTPVVQQPAPGAAGTGTVRVLAVNDIGMHLADLDSRVASIRPPDNVLRAQVVQHPATGTDNPIRNPAGTTVVFSAASNPGDPALAAAPTRVPNTNGVYKSNFWDITTATAYGPLYPAAPSNPFLAPFSLLMSLDFGLPSPSLAGPLQFTQQTMPGQLAPYPTTANGNAPKDFGPLVAIRPFF
ncbi:MAG TPA: Calx-beta domain-containing protein, partial [Burkholderiales bacterium]